MNREPLVDSHGRCVNYLRISLTDLCNFRCVYCTPETNFSVMPASGYLTLKHITRFVRIIGQMGVSRIRLTGGEPLLRKDLTQIIKAIKKIETVQDLSLTTNGSTLKENLPALKSAGLDRINISLDSTDPERFKKITGLDECQKVMGAVHEALSMGFPVKLNMVVLQGMQQEDILNYVSLAKRYPLEVRFLEFMPLCGSGWMPESVLSIQTVRTIVKENFLLEKLERGDNVAETYQIVGSPGKVGFIASLSESFCDNCSRIRLSANGNIQPCLFSEESVSVKQLLQEEASEDAIEMAIREAVRRKPRGNWFRDNPFKEGEAVESEFQEMPRIRFIGG